MGGAVRVTVKVPPLGRPEHEGPSEQLRRPPPELRSFLVELDRMAKSGVDVTLR